MLGRSNSDKDSQTSGVLIQYIHDISAYLREVNISRKTTVLAAAVLVLAGLLGVRYREGGLFLPTSSDAGRRDLPIYCVQTDAPEIALTFDAAWGNEDTRKIMELLKKHDIKVTFFMTGGWVEAYPDDVKMILAEGHDLGNHSQNHKNMSQLSDAEKEKELMTVHDKVKELTGYDMFLFRPPYGDYDAKLIKVAQKCKYYPIQWDVDSLDWKDYGVDSIVKTVTENEHLGNGSIILCHNGAKYTAEALDTLITTLKAQGYQFVPLSELIYRENYHMDHEGRQIPDSKKS
ncbi:MAG: polysaccharide deacetylase family protein [Lachnospiraceae bacterium]|nr:polysaccharide deacetylase family protein [Lachnospiraceae bacterium]